ncbi:hypothetical protein C7431_10356 [Pantoea allii]|uniref:Uncharacterized protein n=1 Tax=Pantoea allii TaxID=574096 RepID=A0A2V2BJ04_9GAMM|nr:hypothetical protein C7431_10356 [Pantoea allii]TWD34688.1 hypothetical protein FBY13_11354 [Pantoea sp. SJZ147]
MGQYRRLNGISALFLPLDVVVIKTQAKKRAIVC